MNLDNTTDSAAPVAPVAAVPAAQKIDELQRALVAQIHLTRQAEAAAAPPPPALTGKARFSAAVAGAMAAKPKARSHPGLTGREKFCAAATVDATPQILPANKKPIAAGLTGRARFAAAVKKSK